MMFIYMLKEQLLKYLINGGYMNEEKIEIYLSRVNKEEKEILYRLLQYSLFEESENDLNEMNEEAIFEYEYFDSYFVADNRYAYFIREKGTDKLLGFAMINQCMQIYEYGHSIAEYLVIPKYRRNKIGKKVAIEIFDKYPGNWEVKPSYNSEKAYLFWKNVIKEYTDNNYEFKDGIFLFNNEK